MPPEVVSMSPDNTIPVILDSDTTLLLFVEDPEADPVVFTWTMSGRGWLGEATPVPTGAEDQGYYGSQIPIVEDPDYDQRTVSCDIWDGVSEHVSVQWELEVAE